MAFSNRKDDPIKGGGSPRMSTLGLCGLVLVAVLVFLGYFLFVVSSSSESEDSSGVSPSSSEVQRDEPVATPKTAFVPDDIFTEGPGDDAGTGGVAAQ